LSQKIPTIVDNRGENTLLSALSRLLAVTKSLDIATGTFEVGSLLALDSTWQGVDQIRVVMGDETTKRTKNELVLALRKDSDRSIEEAKEKNDALSGLSAVRDGLTSKKILVRAYPKAKFHAKCYLMDTRDQSLVDFAVVGSSNFTRPGLTQNLELNLVSSDQSHIQNLKDWYDEIWQESETVNAEILSVIEPHLREYSPFTAYARALCEYFAGRETMEDEWEEKESVIYRLLSQYQKDGYHRALQIADKWEGALICDGVGLGKTFIGLMLIERFMRDKKRVLLIVPKSAQKSVWERDIDRYLKPHYRGVWRSLLRIARHTDFGRQGTIDEETMGEYRDLTDMVLIDEAHHFRNPNANRGRLLFDIAANKKLFMLTATPVNNSLDDLYHLINYFAQNRPDHFSRIRINHLRRYFLDQEKRLAAAHPDAEVVSEVEDSDFLRTDELLKSVLIQRSRKYVRDSEPQNNHMPLFPERQKPRVVEYSLKEVYASVYAEVKDAFDKRQPLLSLAIYNTSGYAFTPDETKANTQKQVVALIRVLLLKRLESSFKAFEASLEDLLFKMAQFLKVVDPDRFIAWDNTNKRWWKIVQDHINERFEREEEESEEENDVPEFLADFRPEDHDVEKLLRDVQEDMRLVTDFLSKLYRRFYVGDKEGVTEDPEKDDKLQQLLGLLKSDKLVKGRKVLIFSEFRATARYLAEQLRDAGIADVEQVDSGRNVDNREEIIKRFAPYYNCFRDEKDLLGETELSLMRKRPIDVLISTDVLSEGLNLQDCSLIINYDLHWNPVRLMQRIGRVDRRLNPEIEVALKRPADLDGKIYFWNFLPPRELEDLLHLKKTLDGKILRINRTLGIESPLLTPDDEGMALKLFNERYEGRETIEELMSIERRHIEENHRELWATLRDLPLRLFSGKAVGDGFAPIVNRKGESVSHLAAHPQKGLFCCYRMPVVLGEAPKNLFEQKFESTKQHPDRTGEVRWYFVDAETGKVSEDMSLAWTAIRCTAETKRRVTKGVTGLAEARKAVEKHIKNTYLRDVQAAVDSKPVLLAWMEID